MLCGCYTVKLQLASQSAAVPDVLCTCHLNIYHGFPSSSTMLILVLAIDHMVSVCGEATPLILTAN